MSDTPVTSHRNTHQYLRPCVEACSDCHKTCLNTAMTHCLEAGGKHLGGRTFSPNDQLRRDLSDVGQFLVEWFHLSPPRLWGLRRDL